MSQTSSSAITAEHLEDLQKSGLNSEFITQAGLYSLTTPSEIESALGFTAYGVKSALVFPYSPSYKRLKLFPPMVNKDSDTVKYLQRKIQATTCISRLVWKTRLKILTSLFASSKEKKRL